MPVALGCLPLPQHTLDGGSARRSFVKSGIYDSRTAVLFVAALAGTLEASRSRSVDLGDLGQAKQVFEDVFLVAVGPGSASPEIDGGLIPTTK